MSHFSVAVFSKTPGNVEALLAPFNEQVEPGSPYAAFIRDENGRYDESEQAKGYWGNPNARWDWWEIGGRWRGMLRLLPDRPGYRAPDDVWGKGFHYPPRRCDAAFVRDCDFSPDADRERCARREWEVLVEGSAPRAEEEFFNLWKPEFYLKRYGDKETYIRREAAFSTYAFVTADGRWFGQEQMGWFGLDNADNGSIGDYERAFAAYLKQAWREGLAVTIVDCHI